MTREELTSKSKLRLEEEILTTDWKRGQKAVQKWFSFAAVKERRCSDHTGGGGEKTYCRGTSRFVSRPFLVFATRRRPFWILTTDNTIMGAVRWKCPLSTAEYDQLGSGPWAKPDQMAAPRSLKREKLTKRPVIPSIVISLPFFLAFWSMDWGCACGQSDQERWSRVERIPSVFSKNDYLAKVVWCAVKNGRSQRIAPSIIPFSSFKISLTKYGMKSTGAKLFNGLYSTAIRNIVLCMGCGWM